MATDEGVLAGAAAEDEYVGGHYGGVCDYRGCGWVMWGGGGLFYNK